MKSPTGYTFYKGPSMLDGLPVVGVVLTGRSANSKTGNLVQTYVLADNGLSALESARSGADRSVCGNCPHRRYHSGGIPGKAGACYVNLGQGPRAVSDGIRRGIYPALDSTARERLRGRLIRLGSYGDPAAIPFSVWADLLKGSTGHTGYTHQWRDPRFSRLGMLCMASVDNEAEAHAAWAEGWRTFRVKSAESDKLVGEVTCPASAEAGHKVTCSQCLACDGAGSKRSIVINAHGSLKGRFEGGV